MFKKFLTSAFCIAILLTIGCTMTTFANEKDANKVVLEQFLQATKEKNVDKMVEISRDTAYSSLEIYKNFLKQSFMDPNQEIRDFVVLDKVENLADGKRLYANITWVNGNISEVKFRVKKEKGEYVVYVKDCGDSVKLAKGKEIPYVAPQPKVQVATWNFSADSTGTGRKYTSNFSHSSNSVSLNYRHTATSVTYSVVKYGVINDEVLASKKIYEAQSDKAYQLRLTVGTGVKLSNVCIRIQLNTSGKSFGEAYCG